MNSPTPSGFTHRAGSRLLVLRERLGSSLWPIPLLMLLAGMGLVQLAHMADETLGGSVSPDLWWLHSGTGSDARDLLTTLAAAIITMSSVVFSITVVTLSLAADQFGSRLVRAYMRDPVTKLALGFFLLTTAFCLLALRTVSESTDPADVPHLTVTAALVLSILCMLVLVFFLHRVATSIVADEVIRRVARELDEAIEELPPADGQCDRPDAAGLLPAGFEAGSTVLESAAEGYVQEIDYERLAACAEQAGVVLRLDAAAGDYLCKHDWMGRVHPAQLCAPDLLQQLQGAVVIGGERTPVQDLAYSLRHLVDIALRALSPGINDPNTARVVLDHLRGALSRLLGKALPHGVFRDASGACVLLARRHTHGDILAFALRSIRDAAAAQPLVIVSMLQGLCKLAEHARKPAHAEAIWREASLIREVALARPVPPGERDAIEASQQELRAKLAPCPGWQPPPPQPQAAGTASGPARPDCS